MSTDFKLDLEGISGKPQDKGHKDNIESWSWGETQSGTTHSGGGSGGGKVTVNDLSVTKYVDRDELERLVAEGEFDGLDDVVFLDPGGEQGSPAGVLVKIGGVKGEAQDEQDMGAWSPLSDFSDDILL